jgi:hypothetical protein
MKRNFTLFFLFISLHLFSQSVEKTIIVKDIDSNQPIQDATVYVVKSKQTLLSNSEGIATFELKGGSNLIISHTSYLESTVRTSVLKEKENVIYLKSNLNDLDEIILSKQHPQKVLKSLIRNSVNQLIAPVRLKVYSREFFKLNGSYSYYTDGLMNFQIFSKSKDFKSTILVEQNRSFGLVEEEINNNLLGYNFNNIMENYYNFKYLNALLEPKALKEYDFLIKVYSSNKEYYVISAKPLNNAVGLLDDFEIVYNPEKKLIIEVSSVISPMTLAKVKNKTTLGSKNIYKSIFKTIYRIDGSDYYLMSSKEEIGFERVDKNRTTEIEVRNYFVTTNFSNQNYSFEESDVFKDKNLFNKKNKILTDYWTDSGLVPTDEEFEIIKSIELRQE